MTLAQLFEQMRATARAEPIARARQSISAHGQTIALGSARWSVILTVNR